MADTGTKKPGGTLIAFLEGMTGPKKGAPMESEDGDWKPSAAELSAAKDILAAIKADDADALCKALYAHKEVQELGPESEKDEA